MSRPIDRAKYSQMVKGWKGISPNRRENTQLPSNEQLKYIDSLVELLERNGIDASSMVNSGTKKYRSYATSTIRALRQVMADNNLFAETRTEYINLCRHKETGKKIKYRTTKWCSAPVGYEFLGMLSKETVTIQTA